MNGEKSAQKQEIEEEDNDIDFAERQSLTGDASKNLTVKEQRFCCFRFRFWSVQAAGDDQADGKNRELHVRVVVQTLRLAAMSLFALLVVLAISLTKIFNGGIPEDNIIKKSFGANNVCLYFDFAPAIYVMPPLWSLVSIVVAFYCVASIYRYRIAWAEGKLTASFRKILSFISSGFILAVVGFSLCFAVQPRDHTRLIIHTLPFTHLIIWQILEQGAVVYFGFKCGWTEKDSEGQPYMPTIYKWISLLHWILQAVHGIMHVIYQLNGLLMKGGLFIKVTTPWFATMGEFSGYVYLFLAFVCPFLQSAYETYKNKRTHKLLVIIRDNRDALL